MVWSRLGRVAIAACACLGTARAQPGPDASTSWDHTYVAGTASGAWPCLVPGHDIAVTGGRFSIPFDATVDSGGQSAPVSIGKIDGSVRDDGTTATKTVFLRRLPPEFLAQAARYHAARDVLHNMTMTVRFTRQREGARLEVTGNGCSASWTEARSEPAQPAEPPALDCNSGVYAVALWAATRDYKTGAFARVAVPGEPTRLYRCAGECATGTSPADGGGAWSLVGRCAGQGSPAGPAQPPPAGGASKWDVAYKQRWESASDWRCPNDADIKTLVVSHGQFSIPWNLRADRHNAAVGRIDGVIQDDGATSLATTFATGQLPAAAMADLKAAPLAMTFMLDTDVKKNPKGVGRRAHFSIGKDCEVELEAVDYQPQQFREEDGWRVACRADSAWDAKRSYDSGTEASVQTAGGIRRKYRCIQGPRCDAGERPDGSKQWEKAGRCE